MPKILIAETSNVVKKLLKSVLDCYEDIEICAFSDTGLETYQNIFDFSPDIILMDHKISKPDCIESIKKIMKDLPTPIAVMVSKDIEIKEKSEFIKAGAVCTIEKPLGFNYNEISDKLNKIIKLYSIGDEKKELKSIDKYKKNKDFKPEIICIGSSTGGPDALIKILSSINTNLNVPIIIVQHITAGFNENLVKWLQPHTKMLIKTAENKETIKDNIIYLPSDNSQLLINENKTFKNSSEKLHSFICPSIDLTFHSIVKAYKKNILGIILTGMGKDGAVGIEQIYKSGGYTIAQDRETSVVFGMPKAAIEKKVIDSVLPINKIGGHILSFFDT